MKIGPKPSPATGPRLRLKPRANVEKIKELIGGIADKRFYKLQKKLIWDLDAAGFKTIDLGLYMRLGGWSHTGGTYVNAMMEVAALGMAMFGYKIPERIGRVNLREYRYRPEKALAAIFEEVAKYHNKKLKVE